MLLLLLLLFSIRSSYLLAIREVKPVVNQGNLSKRTGETAGMSQKVASKKKELRADARFQESFEEEETQKVFGGMKGIRTLKGDTKKSK